MSGGYPPGCFVSGSTLYYCTSSYTYVWNYYYYYSSSVPCSATQTCLCAVVGASLSGSSGTVKGGAGGGRVKVVAGGELRILGVVAADGSDGDNCTLQFHDYWVKTVTTGSCDSGWTVSDSTGCATAASSLAGSGYSWQGSTSSPTYPKGCVAVGTFVYWNAYQPFAWVASGTCDIANQVGDASTCMSFASQTGLAWGGTQYSSRLSSYPAGCFQQGSYLYYGSSLYGNSACSSWNKCLCLMPAPACAASSACVCAGAVSGCGGGGGGAGGSVQLEADVISGEGTVLANGGRGGSGADYFDCGAGFNVGIPAHLVDSSLFVAPILLNLPPFCRIVFDGGMEFTSLQLQSCSELTVDQYLNAEEIIMNQESLLSSPSALNIFVEYAFIACNLNVFSDIEIVVQGYLVVVGEGGCTLASGQNISLNATEIIYFQEGSLINSQSNINLMSQDIYVSDCQISGEAHLIVTNSLNIHAGASLSAGSTNISAQSIQFLPGSAMLVRSSTQFVSDTLTMGHNSLLNATETVLLELQGSATLCSVVSAGPVSIRAASLEILSLTDSSSKGASCQVKSLSSSIHLSLRGKDSITET